jgi:phage tail P2-like protein
VASVSNDLLPSSATPQERAMAETIARVSDVPVLVRESWNPDTCPAELLPWLAWAFSVDEWDVGWSEQERREVIKNSLFVHKKKGTISAIDRALGPLGYLIDVVEWFEESPPAAPYTFKIVVGTADKPVTADLYPKVERIVMANKNLRSQMTGITIKSEIPGQIYCGSTTQIGPTITVYPYLGEELEIAGTLSYAAGLQLIETVSVRPQA